MPDDPFREAVLTRASSGALREFARSRPEFLTMQEDGVLKAVSGVTCLSEVLENAPRDSLARPLAELQRIARTRGKTS